MTPVLITLDQYISSKRAAYYADLQPGLEETAISALEAKHGIQLPADLRQLYSWHNGQKDSNFEAFVNNSTFLSLEHALDVMAEITSMMGSDPMFPDMWHAHWIPLFSNGGGDYICYDLKGSFGGRPGQLIEYWRRDQYRNIIASDLHSFLSALMNFYEQLDTDAVEEYFTVADLPGYPYRYCIR
jgi:cell wall assembly regulator SMI1